MAMGGNETAKRPRTDNQNLATNANLEEEVKRLRKQNNELTVLAKELKAVMKGKVEVVDKLKGMLECSVCMVLPRQGGPIPVCNNGHFVCIACRDRLRIESGEKEIKCPSCNTKLGNDTSILASKLVEIVDHECEFRGCKVMVAFSGYEQHKKICKFRQRICSNSGCAESIPSVPITGNTSFFCLFRKVHCPIDRNACISKDDEYEWNQLVQFNKLEEHWEVCSNGRQYSKPTENNSIWKESEMMMGGFKTKMIKAHGRIFFLKISMDVDSYFFETLMLGTEEECDDYLVSILIFDKNMKIAAAKSCHPRAMDKEIRGNVCLTLSNNDMKMISLPSPVPCKRFNLDCVPIPYACFKMKLSIDKL